MSIPTKGFVYKQMQSKAHHIRGVSGVDAHGKKIYHYILLNERKIQAFEQAMKVGKLELTDYGRIIVSGYDEPSEEVKQRMLDDFGFTTDNE